MKLPRYYSDEFHRKTFPIRFMIKNQVIAKLVFTMVHLVTVQFCEWAKCFKRVFLFFSGYQKPWLYYTCI